MLTLRRRLASWALALVFVQAVAVFAAPLASCCVPKQVAAAEQEHDCCPAGSHPPGQCPRHAATTRTSCRMQCDAPHGVQLLVAAPGVLAAPTASAFAAAPGQPMSIAQQTLVDRASIPPSPPPRLS